MTRPAPTPDRYIHFGTPKGASDEAIIIEARFAASDRVAVGRRVNWDNVPVEICR